ncbi:MAG: twin-arginine translocase subunit TatC [Clostridia bacterium]
MKDDTQTIVEHLGELRTRIIIVAASVIIFSLISYQFIDKIITLAIEPANDLDFIYITPSELFLTYVKTSILSGTILSLPVILYQIWRFVLPGITLKKKIYMAVVNIFAMGFFATGAYFAYKVIIPITLEFFTKFSRVEIAPMFTFANYTSFLISLLLAFGVAFELPIVVMLLTQFNLITPHILKSTRKYIILAIFILAAVLTPPDIVSQGLLALPMVILLELSILISTFIYKGKKK